jgi:hypothetical protein
VVALLAALAVWYHADVALRGRVDPLHPELHMTDFTVFTEAGAALFDGRDPYAVTNPRGWHYLYPPLFALMVAPLSVFDPVSQVFFWYVASIALGFGCAWEMRRIGQWMLANPSGSSISPSLLALIALCAGMVVLLPSLECLQRGQLGIALLYALLLGFRVSVTADGWKGGFLGGLALSWPAAVKLVPVLPATILLWQFVGLVVRPRRARSDFSRASALAAGLGAGGLMFLLLIPGAFLGWDANLRHLRTWTVKVLTNPDPGHEAGFHVDSATNQSLSNAAHSLAIQLRPLGPNDPRVHYPRAARTPAERRWAEDKAVAELRRADHDTRRWVRVAQAMVIVFLASLAFVPRRGDRAGMAAAFGLSCAAPLLISPVAWTHYYMFLLPAAVAIPCGLAARGRPIAARWFAAAPAVLVWTHYLVRSQVGPIGLLGLGTAVWFVAGFVVLAADRLLPTRPAPSQRAPFFTRADVGSQTLKNPPHSLVSPGKPKRREVHS